jgi:excisionase family DNA binding protein
MGEERTEVAQYITVGEAARLLGVHRNTVRNRIKDGRIIAHKVLEGEREVYRIDADSLGIERTSAGVHNKVAQRTTSGGDVVQLLMHRINTAMQEVGDLREQLGEERGRRLRVEEENEQLRQELEALREPRESPQTPPEEFHGTHAPPISEHPVTRRESDEHPLYGTSRQEAEESLQRRSERSWWRRFFGFE